MRQLLPVLLITFALIPMVSLADTITFSGASDITAEATSSVGAYVSFNVTAEDASSTPLTVSCDHESPSLFALGTTTVSCSASDATFSTSTTSFGVGVVDTVAPAIIPPATQYFATSTFPASPTLTRATATDAVDPNPTISYGPTMFSVGTTTVTWTATDASGNASATTSLVVITDDASTSVATSTTPIPVTITLDVETATTTVFDGPLTVSACPESQGSATSTVNGYCALEQSGLSVSWQWFSFGAALISVNGDGDWNNGPWWTTFSNGQPLTDSLNEHELSANETLLATDGPMPLEASVSTTSPEVGATTTVTVMGFNSSDFQYEPLASSTVSAIGQTYATDGNGDFDITATSSNPFTISVSATGFLSSAPISIEPFATTTSSQPNPPSGGGGGGSAPASFNTAAALTYLSSHQKADGSFDTPLLTDWAALAFAATNDGSALSKIKSYEESASLALPSATDFERHAMALEAVGINPYSGTATDYITPIVQAFDGTQVGNPSEDNDDIFALFPLLHAGYSSSDVIIQKEAAFILSKQMPDGSWDESPDLTAAAIDALGPLYDIAGVNAALGSGVGYLLSQQGQSGGWSSVDSTSWAQTAINGIILSQAPGFSSESAFANPSGKTPLDALLAAQQADGAVQPASDPIDTRVWSTSYAIVAASGKDWATLLQSFALPTSGSPGGGGIATDSATSTSATSTTETATSTDDLFATSTLPATTTQPLLVPASSTTTFTTSSTTRPLVVHHLISNAMKARPKVGRPISSPATTSSEVIATNAGAQTAAAANGGRFFAHVWNAIVSFFSTWL